MNHLLVWQQSPAEFHNDRNAVESSIKLLQKYYRMDVVVDDVVVELKSMKELIPQHRAQQFNYLRITKKPVGLLINFGRESLQGERYGYIKETSECVLLDKNMELLYEDVDWEYEEPERSEEINS